MSETGVDEAADPRVVRSRARILRAAADLLAEQGPAALTVEAVVQRSGVARMTVYRHWATRDELVADAFRALVPVPGPPDVAPGPAAERLRATVHEYGRQFRDEPWAQVVPALLDASRRDPALAVVWQEFAQARGEHLEGLVAACVAEGSLAAGVRPDVVVSQLVGPLSFRRFLSFEPIDAAFCDALVDDVLAAHRP